MDDVTASGGASSAPEETRSRRALCVWLAVLSSWRQGLVGRLVREYGSVDDLLGRPTEELAARVMSGSGRGTRAGTGQGADKAETVRRRDAEGRSDAARLRDAVRRGPGGCGAVSRGRPPGDLVVAWTDGLYPPCLRQLADPPLCLFVRGGSSRAQTTRRLSALVSGTATAVVGTRSPSPYGREMAALLGRDLARRGMHVVSGLALGIDAAAQAAAVEEAGDSVAGLTVAVLGSGADVPYPRTNEALYHKVVRHGLVVSEFAWGVPARSWRFPARNRVMAGLSRATVIVEGTRRSGARITADFAADLGREVLAVPGEAGRRLSEAPHALLRQGAGMCEGAIDVLQAIESDRLGLPDDGAHSEGSGAESFWQQAVAGYGAGAHREVLRALNDEAFSVDELTDRCGLDSHTVCAALGRLEVDGLVRRGDGGVYRLVRR